MQNYFKHSNLLSEQSPINWRLESFSGQTVKLLDKDYLYRQGGNCPHVFLIIEGLIKLSWLKENGDEWTVALVKHGDLLGNLLPSPGMEIAMPESAQAIGNAELMRLEQGEFKSILAGNPGISWQVLQNQFLLRRQAEHKLVAILGQSVEKRGIEMLKELAVLFGRRCQHGYALEIQLTQQQLADLIGASRPVISTLMNELRSRGLLDYTRELICVTDDLLAYPP